MIVTGHEMAVAMLVVARQLSIPPIRVHYTGAIQPRVGPDEIVFVNVNLRRFDHCTSVFPYHVELVDMWMPSIAFCIHGFTLDGGRGTVLYSRECFKLDA
jgi:hypothetical protein